MYILEYMFTCEYLHRNNECSYKGVFITELQQKVHLQRELHSIILY